MWRCPVDKVGRRAPSTYSTYLARSRDVYIDTSESAEKVVRALPFPEASYRLIRNVKDLIRFPSPRLATTTKATLHSENPTTEKKLRQHETPSRS